MDDHLSIDEAGESTELTEGVRVHDMNATPGVYYYF